MQGNDEYNAIRAKCAALEAIKFEDFCQLKESELDDFLVQSNVDVQDCLPFRRLLNAHHGALPPPLYNAPAIAPSELGAEDDDRDFDDYCCFCLPSGHELMGAPSEQGQLLRRLRKVQRESPWAHKGLLGSYVPDYVCVSTVVILCSIFQRSAETSVILLLLMVYGAYRISFHLKKYFDWTFKLHLNPTSFEQLRTNATFQTIHDLVVASSPTSLGRIIVLLLTVGVPILEAFQMVVLVTGTLLPNATFNSGSDIFELVLLSFPSIAWSTRYWIMIALVVCLFGFLGLVMLGALLLQQHWLLSLAGLFFRTVQLAEIERRFISTCGCLSFPFLWALPWLNWLTKLKPRQPRPFLYVALVWVRLSMTALVQPLAGYMCQAFMCDGPSFAMDPSIECWSVSHVFPYILTAELILGGFYVLSFVVVVLGSFGFAFDAQLAVEEKRPGFVAKAPLQLTVPHVTMRFFAVRFLAQVIARGFQQRGQPLVSAWLLFGVSLTTLYHYLPCWSTPARPYPTNVRTLNFWQAVLSLFASIYVASLAILVSVDVLDDSSSSAGWYAYAIAFGLGAVVFATAQIWRCRQKSDAAPVEDMKASVQIE